LVLGIAIDIKRLDLFKNLIQLMQEQSKDVNSMITTAVHHARYNIHDIMFRDRFLGVVEDF